VEKNIAHAEELVRQAAAKGAEIVLLPELFERPYFCQERRYEYYEYAQTAEENPAVRHFSRVAAELGIVIPVSFYEKEVNNTYNSVAVLDADGKNLGVYRKTHIPDDHYYQEKFYFTFFQFQQARAGLKFYLSYICFLFFYNMGIAN